MHKKRSECRAQVTGEQPTQEGADRGMASNCRSMAILAWLARLIVMMVMPWLYWYCARERGAQAVTGEVLAVRIQAAKCARLCGILLNLSEGMPPHKPRRARVLLGVEQGIRIETNNLDTQPFVNMLQRFHHWHQFVDGKDAGGFLHVTK